MEEKQRIWVPLVSIIIAIALIVTSTFFVTGKGLFLHNQMTKTEKSKTLKNQEWRLDSLYSSDQSWQNDFLKFKSLLKAFETYKGHMGDSAKTLKATFEAKENLDRLYDRLYAYALLRRDGNFTDESAKTMWIRISGITSEKGVQMAFFYSELYKIPKNKVRSLANEPLLSNYHQHLISIAEDNYEPDERADYIKAISGNLLSMPEKFYQAYMYEYADQTNVEHDLFTPSREDANRETRKKAFDQGNQKLERGMPLLSTAMAAKVEANKFKAKSEGYQDIVESFINEDGIDLEMYTVLMQEAEKDSDLLKRYMSYRKTALKIKDRLKYYDANIKTTKDYGSISYEKAVLLNREVVKSFGKKYASVFDKAIKEQWMDVYPRDNKYTGNYTYSSYTTHPFVLLNYEDNLESAATLAHESGHAVHQYLNNQARSYDDADIPMIHAEIASTVNEVLFYDQLLKSAKSDSERATILEATLENYNSGFFYQAALAKFQDKIHHDSEAGLPLETSYFNKTFGKVLSQYYGPDYEVSTYDEEGWAQVDHLYWDFYVYKYVMCMAVAIDIADRLESGDAKLLRAYGKFLEVGSTKSVQENLSDLGVDLSKADYLKAFSSKYNKSLDELISLELKMKQ